MSVDTLRGLALVALAVVASVVWLVYHTIELAQNSHQRVAHTQEVLMAVESVLSTLADTGRDTRRYLTSTEDRQPDQLDRAEHSLETDLNRVATLTVDNPAQQARVRQLREDAARTLAALRTQWRMKGEARRASPPDDDAERDGMDAARTTLRAMRAEENRLLGERVLGERAAGLRVQQVTFTLVVVAVGLLGWIGWLVMRAQRRQREDANALRHAKDDLTSQVDAQAAELRMSNERLRSIIDSAVDGIIVIDRSGIVEAFNHGAERLFGYPQAEVIGRNVSLLMPSPYHEEHDGYLARYLDTGAPRVIGIGRAVTGRRRDGTTFPLHLSVGEMAIDGERKFTGILHDLSVRVRIEEQLREQTALARLGEMAALIAHEVKNPLAGVRGAIQVIGTRLPKDGKDAAMVREIVSRIDTLNDLMKDLLLFARPPQPRPAPIDLATLVAATADLLRSDPPLKDVRVSVAAARRKSWRTRISQDRVREPAGEWRPRDAGAGNYSRVPGLGRRHVSDCVRGRRPGYPIGGPRQDLHPLLHDQVPGIGVGSAHGKAPDRGPPRDNHHYLPNGGRHHRHRRTPRGQRRRQL